MIENFQKAVDERAMLLHLPTGVAGRAKALAAVVGGQSVELDDGNAFVAVPANFVVLSVRAHDLYAKIQASLRMVVREIADHARSEGVDLETFTTLLVAAFQVQLRALMVRRG